MLESSLFIGLLSVLRVLRNTMPESFRGLRKFFDGLELWNAGIYSHQDAKNAKLKEIFLGGLRAFARENVGLTGARSAPYENLRVSLRLISHSF